MTDLYEDLQEDLRQKRLEELWKKWGNYILGGAAAILAGVGAWQYSIYAEGEARDAAAKQFNLASKSFSEAGSEKKAAEAFSKLAQDAPAGYAMAARMNEAAALLLSGDTAKAVAIYDKLAETGAGGAIMADYARYRAALALADTAPQVDVVNRLEPLAAKPGPWNALARELKAYVTWRGGNITEAQKQFDLLANDPSAAENVKLRAKNMSELLTLGIKPSGIAPAPAAALAPDASLDLLPEALRAPEIPDVPAGAPAPQPPQ